MLYIGELFNLEMLSAQIMIRCLNRLRNPTEPEDLESLCNLLLTTGAALEAKGEKVRLGRTLYTYIPFIPTYLHAYIHAYLHTYMQTAMYITSLQALSIFSAALTWPPLPG